MGAVLYPRHVSLPAHEECLAAAWKMEACAVSSWFISPAIYSRSSSVSACEVIYLKASDLSVKVVYLFHLRCSFFVHTLRKNWVFRGSCALRNHCSVILKKVHLAQRISP